MLVNDFESCKEIGDWYFIKNDTYIVFRYSIGWSDLCSIPITIGIKQDKSWLWDGNKEEPTIVPSINVIGIWHGFLTKGKLIIV